MSRTIRARGTHRPADYWDVPQYLIRSDKFSYSWTFGKRIKPTAHKLNRVKETEKIYQILSGLDDVDNIIFETPKTVKNIFFFK